MNGVVGLMTCGDQELWVENVVVSVDDVGWRHGVHVVDEKLGPNLITFHCQVATEVSSDDVMTNVAPELGPVEILVDPPVVTERGFAYLASQ